MNPEDTLIARFWKNASVMYKDEYVNKAKENCETLINTTLEKLEDEDREAISEMIIKFDSDIPMDVALSKAVKLANRYGCTVKFDCKERKDILISVSDVYGESVKEFKEQSKKLWR